MESSNAKSRGGNTMKIVFLHHANVCRGGVERMLCTKANLLAEQDDFEVVMLTYEQNDAPYPYLLSSKVKCIDLGVRLYSAYRYRYPVRYFMKRYLRYQLSSSLKRFLTQHHPDVIVCTDKDANELNALSRVCTNEILLIEAHTGIVDHRMQVYRTTNVFRKIIAKRDMRKLQRAVSKYDLLIALTKDDADCWNSFVKTVVVPNYFSTLTDMLADLTIEKKRVISVGRLDYQKGQDLLLQAWASVESKHPDWQLVIFGDGTEKSSLNTQIAHLNLRNVTIHPTVTDIYSEYMQSDFLVCSSRWESFGLIIIEAMSCGIPVVAFDCDNGPRNIVKNDIDGLLAQNGNVDDLAAKMNKMIDNSSLRQEMGLRARQNVERFRDEYVFKQYLELYRQL